MSDNIRNPQQQRSIDKKNRIIQAGYELFAEKGYFNTNTAEIAKKAGVSTGIVYGYFHDKRDILIDVLDLYTKNNFFPIFDMLNTLTAPIDLRKVIKQITDEVVAIHKNNAGIHQALHSLSAYDDAVNEKFMEFEESLTKTLCSTLTKLGYTFDDLTERVHLAMEILQSYAHECVYDQHKYIDYSDMEKIVIEVLSKMFK